MAENVTAPLGSAQPLKADPSPLGESLDFDIRGLGRRLPRTEAPEGWVKKIERSREGKVWVGSFHLWTTDATGRRVRAKKEKTLGPVSMPKHEAQQKLAEYIEEYTGRVAKQGSSITTFTDLWKAFSAVKSGRWSNKTQEDSRYLFGKHVLPLIGRQPPREVTLTSLQLLLNKMAEDGYRKSGVGQIRTYIKACFEYAMEEELIEKNPARKLVMPNIQKKSCERFLSLDELHALLSQASSREHLILRILAVCGLRPAENPCFANRRFRGSSANFIFFLKKLEEAYPAHQKIRLVLDNHSAHISKETRRYLDMCPVVRIRDRASGWDNGQPLAAGPASSRCRSASFLCSRRSTEIRIPGKS